MVKYEGEVAECACGRCSRTTHRPCGRHDRSKHPHTQTAHMTPQRQHQATQSTFGIFPAKPPSSASSRHVRPDQNHAFVMQRLPPTAWFNHIVIRQVLSD